MLKRVNLDADFCVIGGGMAGICAAIAAARQGLSVVLMHERAVLGGNASSEIRMWICGAKGENNRETGIIEEIALENYYRNPTKNYYIWDTVLYGFIKREKNITLLLNCTCIDAEIEEGNYLYNRNIKINKITGYQMTTQTFFDVHAKNFSDCSGDSILAPLTKAQFKMGRESNKDFGENTHVSKEDNYTMGNSCLLQCRETTHKVDFIPPVWATKIPQNLMKQRHVNLEKNYENFWYLELGGENDTIYDAEKISSKLIPLSIGAWDYIKNSGEIDAKNWELDFLGFLPGKRESRRMVGEYTITEKDITGNKIFDDCVAYGGWPLDDHFPKGFYHIGAPNTNIVTPAPYTIPYRALYSKNVENLYFAGRNTSMTHMAMSSIRVMATCAIMGEAVGYAASLSKKYNLTPHEVYLNKIDTLRDVLVNNDCFIPNHKREISQLCSNTQIINGNLQLKDGYDRPNKIYKNHECGLEIKNGTPLKYMFKVPQKIHSIHITFDSDLNRLTLPGDECERIHSMRCNTHLDSPTFYVPKTLCKEFCLTIFDKNGCEKIIEQSNNLKRAYDIIINKELTKIELCVMNNWGKSNATRIFSFDFN